MTERGQVWKCEICGNIIEVVHKGADSLVCCGKPMVLQKEQMQDPEKGEKHVPIIEKGEDGKILVKVGNIKHPMDEEHYIEWIEVGCDCGSFKQFLKPGDKPESGFSPCTCGNYFARAYCNLHGLWKS